MAGCYHFPMILIMVGELQGGKRKRQEEEEEQLDNCLSVEVT